MITYFAKSATKTFSSAEVMLVIWPPEEVAQAFSALSNVTDSVPSL